MPALHHTPNPRMRVVALVGPSARPLLRQPRKTSSAAVARRSRPTLRSRPRPHLIEAKKGTEKKVGSSSDREAAEEQQEAEDVDALAN